MEKFVLDEGLKDKLQAKKEVSDEEAAKKFLVKASKAKAKAKADGLKIVEDSVKLSNYDGIISVTFKVQKSNDKKKFFRRKIFVKMAVTRPGAIIWTKKNNEKYVQLFKKAPETVKESIVESIMDDTHVELAAFVESHKTTELSKLSDVFVSEGVLYESEEEALTEGKIDEFFARINVNSIVKGKIKDGAVKVKIAEIEDVEQIKQLKKDRRTKQLISALSAVVVGSVFKDPKFIAKHVTIVGVAAGADELYSKTETGRDKGLALTFFDKDDNVMDVVLFSTRGLALTPMDAKRVVKKMADKSDKRSHLVVEEFIPTEKELNIQEKLKTLALEESLEETFGF